MAARSGHISCLFKLEDQRNSLAVFVLLPAGQMQGRPFSITPAIALNAGKMQYLSSQFKEAAGTLKKGLTKDYKDATNQEMATWYLAALQKSGSNDKTVFDMLIKESPGQEEQINNLMHIVQ